MQDNKTVLPVALYDFDGTLYRGNTLLDFWLYSIRRTPGVLLYLPYQIFNFLLWMLRIIATTKFKEAFYSYLHLIPDSRLGLYVADFWQRNKRKIFHWVPAALQADRDGGLFLICISASTEFLLKNISADLGFNHLICTEFSRDIRGRPTIDHRNCKGSEKVSRLRSWAANNSYDLDVRKMVSDSSDDDPLYDLAREGFRVKKGIPIPCDMPYGGSRDDPVEIE